MAIRANHSGRIVKRRPWLTRFQVLAGMTSLALAAGQHSYAQNSSSAPPSPSTTPASNTPLAGPKVNTGAGGAGTTATSQQSGNAAMQSEDHKSGGMTLIHYKFDGTVENVGPTPDRAAVEQLKLTPEQQKVFDKIRTEREMTFNTLVTENFRQIYELGQYNHDKQPDQFMQALQNITQAFKPYFDRGSFIDEMSPYLTFHQRFDARKMLAAYAQARIADVKKANGGKGSDLQIAIRLRLENLGAMVKESVESQGQIGQEEFDRIASELDLSPEQVEQIRAIVGPLYVQKLLGPPPSKLDQFTVYVKVSNVLTSEQKTKFHQMLIQQIREDAATDRQQSTKQTTNDDSKTGKASDSSQTNDIPSH